jgi:SAM-dependent methyltransferase
MAIEPTGRREEGAAYYDAIYGRKGGYDTTRFDHIYDVVIGWLEGTKASVLECGCGTGALADRIVRLGFQYAGFDFSLQALRMCPPIVRPLVYRANAYDAEAWQCAETVIALEVFEHLDDKRVLQHIPSGTRVIFSVPDFNSYSHVRVYPDIESIRVYYAGVLDITQHCTLTRSGKSIHVCDARKV